MPKTIKYCQHGSDNSSDNQEAFCTCIYLVTGFCFVLFFVSFRHSRGLDKGTSLEHRHCTLNT